MCDTHNYIYIFGLNLELKMRYTNQEMGDSTEILVLPFFGQGHLFPCSELCKHFSSLNCKPILIIPSHLSSSVPSDLHNHPSIQLLQIPASSSSPPRPRRHHPDGDRSGPEEKPHSELGQGIEAFITQNYGEDRTPPAFVVMDVMMSWSKEIFLKANIPIVSFFTSGACATTMEYAAWKGHVENIGPNDNQLLSGLPESMGLSYSDAITKRRERPHREHGPGRGRGRGGGRDGGRGRGRGGGRDGGRGRGRGPGGPTRWMDETEGSVAILINTCDDLEAPFLDFLSTQVEKPVFGVGPLLPETFWNSIGSAHQSRVNRTTNYTDDEVIQWLDSKPRGSVIYISFGSEVGPTLKEYEELADALAESKQPFIWVIQPGAGNPGPPPGMLGGGDSSREGYEARGLEEKVGQRGLIIRGWAPQLAILSHPSTGGFLSHCGWNSTVEAIGSGVPFLCWPIRGDQFHDAKLVVEYLKIGYMIENANDVSKMVKKSDIMKGIEGLMGDEDVRGRAAALKGVFEAGFPSSSAESLKALIEIVSSSS